MNSFDVYFKQTKYLDVVLFIGTEICRAAINDRNYRNFWSFDFQAVLFFDYVTIFLVFWFKLKNCLH